MHHDLHGLERSPMSALRPAPQPTRRRVTRCGRAGFVSPAQDCSWRRLEDLRQAYSQRKSRKDSCPFKRRERPYKRRMTAVSQTVHLDPALKPASITLTNCGHQPRFNLAGYNRPMRRWDSARTESEVTSNIKPTDMFACSQQQRLHLPPD